MKVVMPMMFFLLRLLLSDVESNDVCRELLFMNHTPGKALDGHVIKTLQVKNQEQCELGCFHESECVSYNTEPSQVNGFTCELSNSDHVRHPDALVPRPAYIYRGTENSCSSSPCPNNATCLTLTPTNFQCLCPLGYTGPKCNLGPQCITAAASKYNVAKCKEIHYSLGFWIPRCGFRKPGRNCQDIKTAFPSASDGIYWIQPNSGLSRFQAYCDMTSLGGGWLMCYTTNGVVIPRTEVTYDSNLPYGADGYRTDCNNIEFREILFVDETTRQQASFTYEENSMLVAQGNYGTQLPGLFQGGGIADTSYKYQLLVCDISFYSGFFISGYTSNCFKHCHSWCNDLSSPYFRSASTSSSYAGVAFNSNGHRSLNNRLISVGLR